MLKDNIPLFSDLIKAFKTRKAILSGNELYKFEEWEVVKNNYLPAKEMAINLSFIAFIPAWIFSKIFIEASIDDPFKDAFISAKGTLDDAFMPLIIYISIYFGAKYIYPKEKRNAENVFFAQRYFMYKIYSKLFWPIVVLNLFLSILPALFNGHIVFGRLLRDAPEYFIIPFFAIYIILGVYIFLRSLYMQYYTLPKEVLLLKNITYNKVFLVKFWGKYWLNTAFALIIIQVIILALSLAMGGAELLADDLRDKVF